jgi:hypothetical protein
LKQQDEKQTEKAGRENKENGEKGQWVGMEGDDEDGARRCLHSVDGDAAELGEGILLADLLDDPPDGRSKSDMVVYASRHTQVQDSERLAVAREDKRAGIAALRKIARRLAIIVNDRLPRLKSEIGADIGFHTGQA